MWEGHSILLQCKNFDLVLASSEFLTPIRPAFSMKCRVLVGGYPLTSAGVQLRLGRIDHVSQCFFGVRSNPHDA
jgi:hypothetical protein